MKLTKKEQDNNKKIAHWLLDNSEHYFEQAYEEAERLPNAERKSILKKVNDEIDCSDCSNCFHRSHCYWCVKEIKELEEC
jgi:hypothetical protein